ncbi:uncharacterized protein At4g38065-like [Lotus japonicus]|uniref:uncharacterized protein At4g38065-like n=1 Tax=Lotus japonicus TaxID=34305 RepID=UPI002586B5AB|nr:uncharacterized protein At4g38065-like [Lotus japonicus]
METGNGTSPNRSESEPDRLLSSCKELLLRREFTACRDLARRIQRSDSNISAQVDQILTIAEVLGSSTRRPGTTHLDWYSILQLSPAEAANRENVRNQFKTLMRLLDPSKNNFPLADDALMRVREAWLVLSDPVQRARFECECRRGNDHPATSSFWTMCPYCWYLHEYEKKYEDCTFRCGNCLRTFHGVEVKAPAAETVVQGKDEYYCYHLSLPLRYPLEESQRVVFQGNAQKRLRIKTVANRVPMKVFMEPNGESDM